MTRAGHVIYFQTLRGGNAWVIPSFSTSLTLGSSRAGFAISDAHSLSVLAQKGTLDQPGLLPFLHRSPLIPSSQIHTQKLILLYLPQKQGKLSCEKKHCSHWTSFPKLGGDPQAKPRRPWREQSIDAAKLVEQPAAVARRSCCWPPLQPFPAGSSVVQVRWLKDKTSK